jgi:hypothetical protein
VIYLNHEMDFSKKNTIKENLKKIKKNTSTTDRTLEFDDLSIKRSR